MRIPARIADTSIRILAKRSLYRKFGRKEMQIEHDGESAYTMVSKLDAFRVQWRQQSALRKNAIIIP